MNLRMFCGFALFTFLNIFIPYQVTEIMLLNRCGSSLKSVAVVQNESWIEMTMLATPGMEGRTKMSGSVVEAGEVIDIYLRLVRYICSVNRDFFLGYGTFYQATEYFSCDYINSTDPLISRHTSTG